MRSLRYEHHREPLASTRRFALRVALHLCIALALVVVSLACGMVGYVRFEHLSWRDAFLNAAMLLGGMGPVDKPLTSDGKLFAGLYALYAGLVFIVTAGIIVAPGVHRVLHRLHVDAPETGPTSGG